MQRPRPYHFYHASSTVVEHYDEIASIIEPRYCSLHQNLQTVLSKLISKEIRYVVDLGVGTGPDIVPILAMSPSMTYLGVDISVAALEVAKRKSAKVGKFIPICDDLRSTDVELLEHIVGDRVAGRCAVISAMTLHHMTTDEKSTIYSMCSKLVGRNGIFINADLFRIESPILDAKDVERLSHGIVERVERYCRQFHPHNRELRCLGRQWADHYRDHTTLLSLREEYNLLSSAGFDRTEYTFSDGQAAVLLGLRT